MIDQTTQPTTLVMRHVFDASQERVFEAWSSPEILREFIGPGDMRARVEADVRTGGAYRITMLMAQDKEWSVQGVYREVAPTDRIVCSWAWEEDDAADVQETVLTLEFYARGEGTELVLTHENFRDTAQRDRHHNGWDGVMSKLEAVLAKG